MILDSFTSVGKTHHTCEDYSIVVGRPYPFILISDGCSSSKNTDVGARLLALTTKRQFHGAMTYQILPGRPDFFGTAIIESAYLVADQLGLNRSALDATLLLAYVESGLIHFVAFGDGYFIIKSRTGHDKFVQLSYKQNAPYYLTVHESPEILEEWAKVYPENDLEVKHYNYYKSFNPFDAPHGYRVDYSNNRPYFTLAHQIDDIEMAMVSSDGIGTFCRSDDRSLIPPEDVIDQMMDVKVPNGEFIKRRMKKMLEKYANQGVHNLDDVSVSAMIFEESDKTCQI
jgi:hypothetical protein